MVQSAGTVHFDQSEPLVFYYESFKHNYSETKTNNKNNLSKKNFNTGSFTVPEHLPVFRQFFNFNSGKGNKQKKYTRKDSIDPSNRQDPDETLSSIYNTNNTDSPLLFSDSGSDPVNDHDSDLNNGVTEKNDSSQETNGTEPVSEEKVSNATYFYKILFHLIDIASDGSRFKCCKRSPVNPCEPCKFVEKLIYTYFDLTTLEDVIADRSDKGICGYIYCCNQIEKSSGSSKYKIDVVSKSVYDREECDSFCSTTCLNENQKVSAKVSLSPVELGTFTPRAMRNANNDTLKKLYEDVFSLRNCFGSSINFNLNNVTGGTTDVGIQDVSSQDTPIKRTGSSEKVVNRSTDLISRKTTEIEDRPSKNSLEEKRQRIDTFEIFEDFDSSDEMSDSSMSEANVKFYKDPEKLVSIYKPSPHNTDLADNTTTFYSFDRESLDLSEPEDYLEDDYLGIFSWLWYVLSNFITSNTRDFLNSGIVTQNTYNESFDDLYDQCLKGIPKSLDTLKLHIHYLLSTFKPVKNNLLNTKIMEPLAFTIKYVILKNRNHLPLNYDSNLSNNWHDSNTQDLDSELDDIVFEEPEETDNLVYGEEALDVDYEMLLEDVNSVLNNRFQLDQESIDILSELFLDN